MTTKETVYNLLVKLSNEFTHDADYVKVRDSLVDSSYGRINLHNVLPGDRKFTIEDLTPEQYDCLTTYTQTPDIKKPELDSIIRRLGIDCIIENI